MSGNLLTSSAVMAFFAIPSTVIWSYLAFGVALAIGLVTIFLRRDWQKARGLDKLILFLPLFYAAPLAAFGTEHFTLTNGIASIAPRLNPWPPMGISGHAIWTYLAAVVCAVAGILLLVGKKTRAAVTWIGLTVLFVELIVYVPIAVVERASLDNGLNYMGDTLMYCGAILLLASAMPREAERRESSADPRPHQTRACPN